MAVLSFSGYQPGTVKDVMIRVAIQAVPYGMQSTV